METESGDHHIHAGNHIYASREARATKPPFYTIMKYVPPLVLAVVTLRYQGRAEGIFEKNPAPMWCFFVSTGVYWLIVEVMDQIQIFTTKWPQTFRRAAIACGLFSIVSQVSVFLPRPASFVPLVVCAALQPVILAWPLLCRAYDLVQKGITSVFDRVRAYIKQRMQLE